MEKLAGKRAGLAKGPQLLPLMLLAGFLLMPSLRTPSQKPVQAAPPGDIEIIANEYFLDAYPQTKELCVGQTYLMHVYVRYTLTLSIDSQDPDGITRNRRVQSDTYYSGEVVEAVVRTQQTPGVGKISPPSQTTVGGRYNYLEFEFTALKKGNTVVRFIHTGSDSPDFIPLADYADIYVTVSDCYEAITGGVATEFTKKDICSLERPFVLKGTILGGTSTTSFFPFNRELGAYVYSSDFAGCRNIVFGTYDVTFGADNEGNIVLIGPGWSYCPRQPAFRIPDLQLAIKIKPGLVCQGP